MPCDKAISIQYAQIDDDDVKRSLTAEVLQPILVAWAAGAGLTDARVTVGPAYRHGSSMKIGDNHLWLEARLTTWGSAGLTINVHQGRVQVTGDDPAEVSRVSVAMLDLVNEAAYQMTDAKLAAILGGLGYALAVDTVDVQDDRGALSTVSQFTLNF